jgi:beta-N-acetylhexosaminidase
MTAPLSMLEAVVRRLSLRRKVAQLFMPRISGGYLPLDGAEHERLRRLVAETGIGGVIVGMGPPLEIAARLNAVQRCADVPLLVAADVESGPGRIMTGGVILPHGLENGGATRFPPLMALGATGDASLAYDLGRVTALECRAAGIHVAFAPVADVNSNPRNPIIGTRSYGGDAQHVARFVAAHVRGLQDHGMLATPKHFPGHGDAAADSHNAPVSIPGDETRLRAVELVPFRAAIDAGAAAVMVGHIAVPALTGDDVPATLHPDLVDGLLRRELGFDGLVFSDAMDMAAITGRYGPALAALMALRAGIDVLVQPPADEVETCIDAVVAAIQTGALDEKRIDDAVRRVLAAKERLGLFEAAVVSLEGASTIIGGSHHEHAALDAARRSITVLRDGGILPVAGRSAAVLIVSQEHDPLAGRAFAAALAAGDGSVEVVRVATSAGDTAVNDALARFTAAAAVADMAILAPFMRAGVGADANALDARVEAAGQRAENLIVVAFGAPYVLARFPRAVAHVVAWAEWPLMQEAAAALLRGEFAAQGRLPVTVAPLYEHGAGPQSAGSAR